MLNRKEASVSLIHSPIADNSTPGTVGYQQENPVTGVAETFTVPGVELSAIGEWIRDTDASFLFNTPEFKSGFKYTDSHNERVYYQTVTGNQYTLRRADSNGAVDITFNSALPPEYEIDKVAVRRQGAMTYVFVVTKPFLDGNKNSVKVFKLKNDGSLDTSFQTITLKPITGTNLPPVSSIAVDTLQQVYVSFGAHYGLSFSMLDLQVNNINTRTLHPLGAGSSVGSYLPVIKFKPDGQYDQDFKFIHPDINDLAFFDNDIPGVDKNVPIVGVNNAAEGGLVYILLNRRDQVTGYQRPELVGLNQNGQISYSSTVYGDKNKPYWKTIKASKLLNNDCALLVGELYTKNSSNNTWSASPSESLVVYDPVGSALIARDTIVQYTGKPLFALNVVEVYEP
ncbi:MAG: hypothetical protein E6Q68_05160 [Polynucleobacter sp.]|nr:MAG: hypothetical protein E6Q68_05160 [Polynucleobacter sp.]